MHSQIIDLSPGAFPRCGSALRPVWGGACFKATQLLMEQMPSVLRPLRRHFPALYPLTISSLCVSQASNGNDPWSAWNADPSGGSNNNWASNPEGTQTGRSAADPWGSVSQGHPQAYQGPGKNCSFSQQPCLSGSSVGNKIDFKWSVNERSQEAAFQILYFIFWL